jgi:hypothetical protein
VRLAKATAANTVRSPTAGSRGRGAGASRATRGASSWRSAGGAEPCGSDQSRVVGCGASDWHRRAPRLPARGCARPSSRCASAEAVAGGAGAAASPPRDARRRQLRGRGAPRAPSPTSLSRRALGAAST